MAPLDVFSTAGKHGDKCRVVGCGKKLSSAHRKKYGCICRSCAYTRYSLKHPHAYTLNKLRNNAKRRGIECTLTLEQWIDFCNATGYIDARGRESESLTVDRKKSSLGYTADNIRVLTLGDNIRASNRERMERRRNMTLKIYGT